MIISLEKCILHFLSKGATKSLFLYFLRFLSFKYAWFLRLSCIFRSFIGSSFYFWILNKYASLISRTVSMLTIDILVRSVFKSLTNCKKIEMYFVTNRCQELSQEIKYGSEIYLFCFSIFTYGLIHLKYLKKNLCF